MRQRFVVKPRTLALAVATACTMFSAASAVAQMAPAALANKNAATPLRRHYQLPAGPLGTTLTQIGQQSGQSISVDPELVRDHQAPAIHGDFSAAEAVLQAIGNGDLQLQQTGNGTLTLKHKQPEDGAIDAHDKLPEVVVAASNARQTPTEGSGSYTISQSSSATTLNLSLRETPQSISVATRARMDDFHLGTINDVLTNIAGVTVEKVETERTYFTSRGFSITNFQFDGVGVPLTYGDQTGDLDTAMFDRIEIVRGANGLSASTGDPSATVNFIRKRPSDDFQAAAAVTLSSWNTKRIDVDLSGPLNQAGSLAARIVAAHQEGNSYLDRYQPTKDLFYGVIEANLSSATLLTLGHSYQKVHGRGAMWGALPLTYADGSAVAYGVGSSTSADWSYYDSTEQRNFVELLQQLGQGWQWKSTMNYNEIKSDSALLYIGGNLDQSTGTGLQAYPSLFTGANKQFFFDSNVTGKYTLAGRQHDLSLGLSWSRSQLSNIGVDTTTGYFSVDGTQAFNGTFAYPVFDAAPTTNTYADRRKTMYAATRLNLHERIKLLLGANDTQADSTGMSDGVSHVLSQSAVSPYVGLVIDLTPNLSAYGSISRIFNPQYNIDINHMTLAAAQGKSEELGLKAAFLQQRLNASISLFRVEQSNIADIAGTFSDGQSYYHGINARSQGVGFDLSGDLTENWQVDAGAVVQRITGDDGTAVRTYVPRKQLRLASTYRLPQLQKLKLGASLNIQSKTSYSDNASVYQGGYTVLNLMARYDLTKHLSLSANLNNVLNKKYLASVNWEQAYYAAPINGSVAINWKY